MGGDRPASCRLRHNCHLATLCGVASCSRLIVESDRAYRTRAVRTHTAPRSSAWSSGETPKASIPSLRCRIPGSRDGSGYGGILRKANRLGRCGMEKGRWPRQCRHGPASRGRRQEALRYQETLTARYTVGTTQNTWGREEPRIWLLTRKWFSRTGVRWHTTNRPGSRFLAVAVYLRPRKLCKRLFFKKSMGECV